MAASRPLRSVPDEDNGLATFIVVDPGTGEQVGTFGEVTQDLTDHISGLQRDVAAEHRRYENLKRDREAEARESPVWPAAVRVFDYWRKQCRHAKAEWTLDRFDQLRPFLELSGKGKGRTSKLNDDLIARNEARCMLAIDGIAFDPYETPRKNGSMRRHDGWHLIFGNADQFEERCKAAPVERIEEVRRQLNPKGAADDGASGAAAAADPRGPDGPSGRSQPGPGGAGGAETRTKEPPDQLC